MSPPTPPPHRSPAALSPGESPLERVAAAVQAAAGEVQLLGVTVLTHLDAQGLEALARELSEV